MQPQVASEQDKLVPLDTSGDPVDVELKEDKKDDVKVDYTEIPPEGLLVG